MTLLPRIAALILSGSAPAPAHDRALHTNRGGRGPTLTLEREAQLRDAGRKAVDDLVARSRVERDGHFTVPRCG